MLLFDSLVNFVEAFQGSLRRTASFIVHVSSVVCIWAPRGLKHRNADIRAGASKVHSWIEKVQCNFLQDVPLQCLITRHLACKTSLACRRYLVGQPSSSSQKCQYHLALHLSKHL